MKRKFSGKIGFGIAIAVTVCLLISLLTACDFGKNKTTEDTRGSIQKPNLSTVYSDFNKQPIKGSDVDLSLNMTLFTQKATSSLGQDIKLYRDSDGEKFFLKGKSKTVLGGNSDKIIKFLKSANKNVSEDELLSDYLKGSAEVEFAVGAKKDYNVRFDYRSDSTIKTRRYAVADSAIIEATGGKAEDFTLLDILTSEGLFDFSSASEWIDKDEANKFFSTADDSFIYNLSADVSKVKEMIVAKAKEIIKEYFADEDFSLENFDKIANYVAGWITVKPTSVNVLANENGLPKAADINCEIDINIPMNEMDDVLFLACPDKKNEISAGIKLAMLALGGAAGTNGEENTIGIRLSYVSAERFRYGKKNVNFKDVDAGMFADVNEKVEGRTVITASTILGVIEKFFGEEKKEPSENE